MGWIGAAWGMISGFGNWIGPLIKFLTSKWMLVIYGIILILILGNAGISKAKDWLQKRDDAMVAIMTEKFNQQQLSDTLEAQQHTLVVLETRAASQAEAFKALIDSLQARDAKYIGLTQKLASDTAAAVQANGQAQGPQPLSPYLAHALELLDDSQTGETP